MPRIALVGCGNHACTEHGAALALLARDGAVEKPPADTLAKTRALAEAAAASGTIHQVSLNRRFNPWLNRAIAWGRSQGPLAYLRTSMLRSRRDEPDFIWSTGFHVLDAMRHIAGEVAAYADRPMRHAGLTGWWHDATLEFASGARGTLHVLPTCGHHLETYELFGDDWHAVVEIGQGLRFDRLRCWKGDALVVDEGPGDAADCVRTGCYDEMRAFAAGVAAKRAMRPTLMDALPSAELAFAFAARQGVI